MGLGAFNDGFIRKNGGIDISGIKQNLAAFKDMPDEVFNKAVKPAARQAGTVVTKRLRKNIKGELRVVNPKSRNAFAKDVGTGSVVFNRAKGYAGFSVGAIEGKERVSTTHTGKTTAWATLVHLFELGVKPHKNKGHFKGTKNPGIAPTPFVEKTREEMTPKVGDIFITKLNRVIKKQQEKQAKING